MPEKTNMRGCDICHLKPCVKTGEEQRYCFVRYLIVETLPEEHWVKKKKADDIFSKLSKTKEK